MDNKCGSVKNLQLQMGGTCWLHAIINGWLLSPLARNTLQGPLRAYRKAHWDAWKEFRFHKKACPNSQMYFWKYVENALRPKENLYKESEIAFSLGIRAQRSARKNLIWDSEFSRMVKTIASEQEIHSNVAKKWAYESFYPRAGFGSTVRALGKYLQGKGLPQGQRKFLETLYADLVLTRQHRLATMQAKENFLAVKGGTSSDLTKFCDKVFGDSWKDITKSNDPVYNSKIIVSLPNVRKIPGYTLSHAYISIKKENPPNHVIAGFFCNGKPYVLDSVELQAIEQDWTTKKMESFVPCKYGKHASWYKRGSRFVHIKTPKGAVPDRNDRGYRPKLRKLDELR